MKIKMDLLTEANIPAIGKIIDGNYSIGRFQSLALYLSLSGLNHGEGMNRLKASFFGRMQPIRFPIIHRKHKQILRFLYFRMI